MHHTGGAHHRRGAIAGVQGVVAVCVRVENFAGIDLSRIVGECPRTRCERRTRDWMYERSR